MKAVTKMNEKVKNGIWCSISTDKKLARSPDTCKTPMKSKIVSFVSYVWLFLPDFPQTEIACW